MRNLLWAPCLLFSFCVYSQISEPLIKKYSETITPESLKQRLTIIAGPEMEGRLTASEGQRRAAAYIENEMRSFGLQPGNGESYQMIYPLYQDSAATVQCIINGDSLELNKSFGVNHHNYTAHQSFSEAIYVDFEDTSFTKDHLQISGKLVMFDGDQKPKKAAFISIADRVAMLQKKGAAAIIVIQNKLPLSSPESAVSGLGINKFPASQAVNRYFISRNAASLIIGKDQSFPETCKTYKANIELNYSEVLLTRHSSNVIGVLPALKHSDEWLFITAHYDHMGKKDSIIWFGADDDGSGTTALLELAETFAKAKADGNGPRQNIVFMAFSGEEQGLFGSNYYTNHPIYPLEKVSADLNIDMIGRSDSAHLHKNDSVYVHLIGDNKLSSELPGIAKEANLHFGLQLDSTFNDPKDKQRLYYRSDHYNFASKGVPAMFYYDGGHPDYHRPTDTVDKINFELMAIRTRYIFTTACLIANHKSILKRDLDLSGVGTR